MDSSSFDYTLRRTIYCDKVSKNARRILSDLDVYLVENPFQADLIWVRKRPEQIEGSLRRYQLLNHIPNEKAMINKGHLTEHLNAFDRTQTMFDFSLSDIYPESYRLYTDDEREAFLARLPAKETPENLWILKPAALSRGRGIRIMWRFDWLRQQERIPGEAQTKPEVDMTNEDHIVQRYVKNPLLLDGRKSQIRIYWLIVSLNPLIVFLYGEGTVKLSSLPYQLDDFDNPLRHLNNAYQQKQHPDYDPSISLRWNFRKFRSYLTDELKLDDDFIELELKPKFKSYLAYVVRSILELLRDTPIDGLFFGLYGADIILDDTLHPWLAEIQKNPGLSYDDPVKKHLMPKMLHEAAHIMLEVQRRKRASESLAKLDSVQLFESVINEAE